MAVKADWPSDGTNQRRHVFYLTLRGIWCNVRAVTTSSSVIADDRERDEVAWPAWPRISLKFGPRVPVSQLGRGPFCRKRFLYHPWRLRLMAWSSSYPNWRHIRACPVDLALFPRKSYDYTQLRPQSTEQSLGEYLAQHNVKFSARPELGPRLTVYRH